MIENEKRKGKKLEGLHLLPEGSTWLLAEFGRETRKESVRKAKDAMRKIREEDQDQTAVHLLSEPEDYEKVLKIRESGVGASRVPGKEDSWSSWEDAAVSPEALGGYLRDFYKLLDKHHYVCTLYGHFGDGCIHTRITFDTKTAQGVANYRAFMTEASHLVVRHRGSLSGEHGDGQARAEMLPIMFGSDLIEAFREFKSAWDPLIITDGFSCREQIMHGTPRHAMHLAEVLQMAIHQPLPSRRSKYIETGFVQEDPPYPVFAATAGASLLLAGGLFLLSRTTP